MNRYICIHGHFYQPPRENPWLEEIESQDSAYPYHDWNERITAESYAPNAASRILDSNRKIIDIVNNYSKTSFNFGPTLLQWLARHTPDVYDAIIEADKESRKNFSGHGSALAQVYNHMIMPLANSRDKRTQIIWGIRDFEYRFGRKPEGMWLAETAVDTETLDILAQNEMAFTLLAPRQAGRVRKIKGGRWRDVRDGRIDPRMPYLCRLPSGRTITLFFYDGVISQEIAFGGLLRSGETFASRLLAAFTDEPHPQMVHIATDGETYGHHHRHGDMALAYCLYHIESNALAQITVYGEYLEKYPPTHEVEIIENTSWSCSHGVERWRSHCGCNTGREGWVQEWRLPLRAALDWLRGMLAPIYEEEAGKYLKNPWRARDEYISVILDRAVENVQAFFSSHAVRELAKDEQVRVFRLLELQRHAMLMYTSCGWFFDEISGIETTQILRYAARAIQLAEKLTGVNHEPSFIEILQRAPSNVPDNANGAEVYERFVKPAIVDLHRVGAHYAISSLFEDYPDTSTIYAYKVTKEVYERKEAGRQKMAVGKIHMRSNVTEVEAAVSFAVLHLGDHNLIGGVRDFAGDEQFQLMKAEIEDAFNRSDVPEIIHLMDNHFQTHNYSLWHLFRDEQRKVFNRILESALEEVQGSFRRIYGVNYPIMQAMTQLQTPIPKALLMTAEFTINTDLRKALNSDTIDLDQLRGLVEEVNKWPFDVDKTTLSYVAGEKINRLMREFSDDPTNAALLATIGGTLEVLKRLRLELDMWIAQNLHFKIARRLYGEMRQKAEAGDVAARQWVTSFEMLGGHLQVRGI